jgi:hypothetical protein
VIIIQPMPTGRSTEPPSDHDLAGEAGSPHIVGECGIAQTLNLFGLLKVLLYNIN